MERRNPFELREVTSRRGGPVKKPLSRDAIVTVALKLLNRDGLEGMSLRRVAAALETGAASLYAYVDDLRELQTLVLDRALADVELPRPTQQPWRVRLKALMESYFRVLSRSPGLARLGLSTIAAGPNALRVFEALLQLLQEAGVDDARAAWAVDLIMLYGTAIAAEQSDPESVPDRLGPLVRILGNVSQGEFPRVHAVRDLLLSGDGLERFHWAIDVLLAGVMQVPRGAGAGHGSSAGKPSASKAKKTNE